VRHRSSHAAHAIRKLAVVVLDVPEVSDCENDQKSAKIRISFPLRVQPRAAELRELKDSDNIFENRKRHEKGDNSETNRGDNQGDREP
jgi:hypothetical protein